MWVGAGLRELKGDRAIAAVAPLANASFAGCCCFPNGEGGGGAWVEPLRCWAALKTRRTPLAIARAEEGTRGGEEEKLNQ